MIPAQNPVGEIRDLETAENAVQAALTGHLVFSTLHTNDAAGAYTRMIDMGVEPFLVSSCVEAVMAQRLVRNLCPHCKKAYKPNPADLPPDFPILLRNLRGSNAIYNLALDTVRCFRYLSDKVPQFIATRLRKNVMRKVILTILLMVVICASVLAAWPFGKKEKSDIVDIRGFHAVLADIAPTKAEAKAIANLRLKAAHAQHLNRIQTNALELPPEAAPVPQAEMEKTQISVEVRYIMVKTPLAKIITSAPTMMWSGLPVVMKNGGFPTNASEFADMAAGSDEMKSASLDIITTGTASAAIYQEMPIQVRYLEEANTAKLLQAIMSQPMAELLMAPRVLCKQMGAIHDRKLNPFVTSVFPVQCDTETCYQPFIQLFGEGYYLALQVTPLQDDSVRLEKFKWDMTSIMGCKTYQLVDNGETKTKNGTTKSGVSIQAPTVRYFRGSLPEVVIPSGMSLLMAFPGIEFQEPDGNREMFMLITC